MALHAVNTVWFTAAASGTGSFGDGTARSGFRNLTSAAASLVNTNTYTYRAINPNDFSEWENGLGTYSTTGPVLARTTIYESSNAGAVVNFTNPPWVFIVPTAQSLVLSVADRNGAIILVASDLSDSSANGRAILTATDYAAMRALLDLEAGTDFYSIAAANAAFEPINSNLLKKNVTATLAVGFDNTSDNDGTQSSGTYTPAVGGGNFKQIVNNGAFTLAAPTEICFILLQIVNGASAGAITDSGFDRVDGDGFTTVNGDGFLCIIEISASFATLDIRAMQ